MLKIHRKLEYALIALKYMAELPPNQKVTAKEITEKRSLPFDAVSRVLQNLSQKGILKSEHGAQGGYFIRKDLAEVSFYQVIESVLGPIEIVKCTKSGHDCELVSSCDVQNPLIDLNEQLKDFYQSLSVAKLLKVKAPAFSKLEVLEVQ